VCALPSIASAAESVGRPTRVPGAESEGAASPTPKSWLLAEIFYVRAHVCRTGISLCGPDNLVSSGEPFNAIIRIAAPVSELQVLYFMITDTEGAVVAFAGAGESVFVPAGYSDWFVTFAVPDGVYKFVSIAQGLSTGLITFSDYYRFRVGGPSSSGCCP
jgi:hypothetical protein